MVPMRNPLSTKNRSMPKKTVRAASTHAGSIEIPWVCERKIVT